MFFLVSPAIIFFSQNAILEIESAIYNQCAFWEFSIAIIRAKFEQNSPDFFIHDSSKISQIYIHIRNF